MLVLVKINQNELKEIRIWNITRKKRVLEDL